MKKQSSRHSAALEEKKLRALSDSVGDFIRYWGFRRIHGQIWAQVYLSRRSLSGAELTERLGVSKALVSPALKELESHGLIQTVLDGQKTKRYRAEPDAFKVIKDVLCRRESRMIGQALENFRALQEVHLAAGPEKSLLAGDRVKELSVMVELAQFLLSFLIEEMNEKAVKKWSEGVIGAEMKEG